MNDSDEEKSYISQVCESEWKDGVLEGEGEYTKYDADGNIIEHYKGSFSNDRYDGKGIWEFLGKNYSYYKGKIVFRGLFKDGEVVEGVYYNTKYRVVGFKGGKVEELVKK